MAKPMIEELRERKRRLYEGGGAERVAKQHAAGKMTARRCTEFGMQDKELAADGVVTGHGTVEGRLIHVGEPGLHRRGRRRGRGPQRQDRRDDEGLPQDRKPVRLRERLRRRAHPGGHRQSRRLRPVFFHNTLLSGVVPQVSLICGPCAGGAAYSPALTDFIIQTRHARRCSSPGPP
jgi:methylmalonyl-CoA carboxyltransferase large subunit